MSLLPRILAGVDEVSNGDPRSHLEAAAALPKLGRWAPDRLIEEIERSGLRGRGGAAFPVARKMRAVAARRGPTVLVGNGTEGEPASGKDRLLLTELPHLVLDGAAVAARAVGADTAIIAFAETDEVIARSLRRAADERRRSRPGEEPQIRVTCRRRRLRLGSRVRSGQLSFRRGAKARVPGATIRTRRPSATDARPKRRNARAPSTDRPPWRQLVSPGRHRGRPRIDTRHAIGRGRVPGRL